MAVHVTLLLYLSKYFIQFEFEKGTYVQNPADIEFILCFKRKDNTDACMKLYCILGCPPLIFNDTGPY